VSDASYAKAEHMGLSGHGGDGSPVESRDVNPSPLDMRDIDAAGESGAVDGDIPAVSSRSAEQVAISLRQAYQSTLDEAIPDALMDLLRKLD
jgi:Anti-sigma factor NepR